MNGHFFIGSIFPGVISKWKRKRGAAFFASPGMNIKQKGAYQARKIWFPRPVFKNGIVTKARFCSGEDFGMKRGGDRFQLKADGVDQDGWDGYRRWEEIGWRAEGAAR
jgi:hypothetical protein